MLQEQKMKIEAIRGVDNVVADFPIISSALIIIITILLP